MHRNIRPALKNARNLVQVREEMIKLFLAAKQQAGVERIGYVAGIINSGGPEYIRVNRTRLVEYTKKLRKIHKFPLFSAIDVFPPKIYNSLEEWKLSFEQREEKARIFWASMLKSGHITDIFMTPLWDRSKGALDEHETAKKMGIKIHYVNTA